MPTRCFIPPDRRAAGPAWIAGQIRQGLLWVEEAKAPFALLFSAEDLA